MTSVHFLDDKLTTKLKKVQILKEYVENLEEEIKIYNKENKVNNSSPVNGRRMTNLGTFRKYLELYLKQNPRVNSNMTLFVRQLQPTQNGIPLEITVFSKEKENNSYEDLQSDIFDHILAILPEFDLKVFQNSSGLDFREALGKSEVNWRKGER
jgi:miniconductance mechanosensitive channel